MPIEIKELYIKVTVDDPQPAARDNGGGSAQGGAAGNDAIVEKCVDQVMDIINNKKER